MAPLGGPGVPEVCVGHRHAGRRLPGDQEDVLRQVLQGRRQLQRRGLDHAEGGLQAEGKSSEGFALLLCLSISLSLARSTSADVVDVRSVIATNLGRQSVNVHFQALI